MKPSVVLVVRGYDRFSELLRASGFEVLNLEVIKTEPVDDLSELRSKLETIKDYDGLFFTSPIAAEVFADQVNATGASVSASVYVLGDRAKDILKAAGLKVISRDSANTAKDLVESFSKTEFAKKKLLFVRGDRSMRTIPSLLNGIADLDEVVVYRTIAVRPDDESMRTVGERLKRNEIDWIAFFSPSGVESTAELFDGSALTGLRTAAIGTTTAQKATEYGFNVEFVAQRAVDFAEEFVEFVKRSE